MTAWGGQTSNVCHVTFHNDAVITSVSKSTIRSGGAFILNGWDFGDDVGKLTVSFDPSKSFPVHSHGSASDLDVPITPSSHWTPEHIHVVLPKITGVMEQQVGINLTTADGRKSNTVKVHFVPELELHMLLEEDVTVVTCSNQGAANSCNPGQPKSGCFLSIEYLFCCHRIFGQHQFDRVSRWLLWFVLR